MRTKANVATARPTTTHSDETNEPVVRRRERGVARYEAQSEARDDSPERPRGALKPGLY